MCCANVTARVLLPVPGRPETTTSSDRLTPTPAQTGNDAPVKRPVASSVGNSTGTAPHRRTAPGRPHRDFRSSYRPGQDPFYARAVPIPEPMLSTTAATWPAQSGWVMEPKWDGFRLNSSLLHLLLRGDDAAVTPSEHGVGLARRARRAGGDASLDSARLANATRVRARCASWAGSGWSLWRSRRRERRTSGRGAWMTSTGLPRVWPVSYCRA